MTRARRWSRVRRSDEYGTFSYSSSPSTSSASVPVRSKVKMSPSHLALLGVLGSELQLDRLLILRLGEVGSSGAESRSVEFFLFLR